MHNNTLIFVLANHLLTLPELISSRFQITLYRENNIHVLMGHIISCITKMVQIRFELSFKMIHLEFDTIFSSPSIGSLNEVLIQEYFRDKYTICPINPT